MDLKHVLVTMNFLIALAAPQTPAFAGTGAPTLKDPRPSPMARVPAEILLSMEIPRFKTVVPGKIFRGGQPSDAGLKLLAAQGVKTVVSLRGEWPPQIAHEREAVQRLGMLFVHVPMFPKTKPNERDMDFLENKILGNAALYPVFVHCLFGRDRTGLVIGLYRVTVQEPPYTAPAAFREMEALGYHRAFRSLTDFFSLKTGYWP